MKTYIWSVKNDNREIGDFTTKEKALTFIKNFKSVLKGEGWKPYKRECVLCPVCGKPANKETIKNIGECLSCDNMRLEVADMLEEENIEE